MQGQTFMIREREKGDESEGSHANLVIRHKSADSSFQPSRLFLANALAYMQGADDPS
jgi:hypothetical protein